MVYILKYTLSRVLKTGLSRVLKLFSQHIVSMYPSKLSAKEFVKLTSAVPAHFIDELFEFYDENTQQTDPVIRLDTIAKWLSCTRQSLMETLKLSYRENFDYTIQKYTPTNKKFPHANNNKLYLLTPDCFKRLAMMSRSKNAEMIRTYFIEIENLFFKYRGEMLSGMQEELERLERNQKAKASLKDPKAGYMYIVRASEHNDGLVKIGRSKDLLSRLRAYNSGRADDIEVLYMYKVEDLESAEGCVKSLLKKHQYRKYKEVYQANIDIIKELIQGCGRLSAKLHYKKQKMEMTGGFYIVIHEDTPSP